MIEYGLDPVVDKNCKILILGTFPVPQSNKSKEYYANPQNQFWSILTSVCNCDFVNSGYNDKKQLLLQNHIALWDFIESCERKNSTSADRALIPKTFNNIIDFLKQYPNIQKICIDFRKPKISDHKELAGKYNEIMNLTDKINIAYIPSPSKMYWRKPLYKKIEEWTKAIKP
jgi:hypoxanthine-DNA glycosylase